MFDWFFTCLDLYDVSLHLDFCSWYICCLLEKVVTLYDCEIIFILIQLVDWFFTCFYLFLIYICLLSKHGRRWCFRSSFFYVKSQQSQHAIKQAVMNQIQPKSSSYSLLEYTKPIGNKESRLKDILQVKIYHVLAYHLVWWLACFGNI